MSLRQFINAAALAIGTSVAQASHAQGRSIDLQLGIDGTIMGVFGNFISFMAGSIVAVCIALFTLGALFMTISRGKEDQVKRGKDLMIGSLTGLAVVLGSYGILRMAIYLFY